MCYDLPINKLSNKFQNEVDIILFSTPYVFQKLKKWRAN